MTSTAKTGQTWNTEAYAANGRFVATLASGVVALLNSKLGEEILDLGCGDGALTEQLAATGAVVTGVDASPAMLDAARQRNLPVEHHDGRLVEEEGDGDRQGDVLREFRHDQPELVRAVHDQDRGLAEEPVHGLTLPGSLLERFSL